MAGRYDSGAGKVTPEVLAVWRELVETAAMAAIGEAAAPAPRLVKIAKTARSTLAPGVVTRANPCIQLSRVANLYAGETTAGRRRMQAELAEAADQARDQLDRHERPVGADRKDING